MKTDRRMKITRHETLPSDLPEEQDRSRRLLRSPRRLLGDGGRDDAADPRGHRHAMARLSGDSRLEGPPADLRGGGDEPELVGPARGGGGEAGGGDPPERSAAV